MALVYPPEKGLEESISENKESACALGNKGASYQTTEGSRTPYQSYKEAPADKRSGSGLLFTSQALNPALGQNIRKCQHGQKVNGLLNHCKAPEGFHRDRTV